MTDNEIIKALECCSGGTCLECCLEEKYIGSIECTTELSAAALDLIQRQQEELKKYKQTITVLQGLVEVWKAVRNDDR